MDNSAQLLLVLFVKVLSFPKLRSKGQGIEFVTRRRISYSHQSPQQVFIEQQQAQHPMYNSMGITPAAKFKNKCSAEQLLSSNCTSTATSHSTSPNQSMNERPCVATNTDQKVLLLQPKCSPTTALKENSNTASSSVILNMPEDCNSVASYCSSNTTEK